MLASLAPADCEPDWLQGQPPGQGEGWEVAERQTMMPQRTSRVGVGFAPRSTRALEEAAVEGSSARVTVWGLRAEVVQAAVLVVRPAPGWQPAVEYGKVYSRIHSTAPAVFVLEMALDSPSQILRGAPMGLVMVVSRPKPPGSREEASSHSVDRIV